jgi:hypothetical protein
VLRLGGYPVILQRKYFAPRNIPRLLRHFIMENRVREVPGHSRHVREKEAR